jgi:hypothetical protein
MGDKVDIDCSIKRGEDRRGWHLERGWSGIGYRAVIRPVGMTLILNPFKRWNR